MVLSQSSTAEWDVYTVQLYGKRHGLPMYEPGPNDPLDCVRIGDVGYSNRGRFLRFFNIFSSEYDDINKGGVPDDFEPVIDHYQASFERSPLQGAIYSKSVRMIQGGAQVSA